MTTLEQYTAALRAFILQRPGFEPANYGGCAAAYRADYARCLADRNDALALLAHVSRASAQGEMLECLREQLRFGRLCEVNGALEYTTGQYFPTEYRAAACSVLARAIWHYLAGDETDAESVRRQVRNALGKRLARRWFA